MIRFACSTCDKALRVTPDKAGRRVACPGCGTQLTIPSKPPTPFDGSGGPSHCTDWNQLDGVLAGLSGDPRSARLPRASEDRFRVALTAHADAVPGHAVERLGDAVTVEGVEAMPVYRVQLNSLYECRRVEPRQRPHAGEHVPPATVTSARFDPWGFDAPTPEEFVQATDELAVEGSERVQTCGPCGGTGGEGCGGCSGTGRLACGRCSGRGNVPCPQCRGDRKYERLVRTEQRWKNCGCGSTREIFRQRGQPFHCSRCDNNGMVSYDVPIYEWVRCECGLGVVHCPGCGGRQQVDCTRCGATGRLTCEGCRGSGKVISYLAVVRAFEPNTASHAAAVVKTPGRLREAGEVEPVIDLRTTEVPHFIQLTAGPADLRTTIEQAFAEAGSGCPPDHRVTRQQLIIGVANIHRVEYSFAGKTYSAWWIDGPEPVMVPITSPLADAVTDRVDEALRLWEDGEKRAAALMLQDAVAMARSDRRCREALDGRRADIPPELWSFAGRVYSPMKFLKRNPAVLVASVVVGGVMLLGVGILTVGLLAGPKGQPRQQAREVRDAEPKPVRDPWFEEPRPRDEPRPVVPPAAPDSILTADYWPIATGTREYDEVRYEEGRAPGRATRKRVSYLADGLVEIAVVREGVLETGTLLNGGKIDWRTKTPQRPTTARIRRTAEFIEYGVVEPRGTTWLPVVKLGARVGDSWTYPVTDDTRQRDRVARFDLRDGRPCVVIEGVITPVGSDETIGETIDVLVKGVGLVERRQFVVQKGKKVLVSERLRVEE